MEHYLISYIEITERLLDLRTAAKTTDWSALRKSVGAEKKIVFEAFDGKEVKTFVDDEDLASEKEGSILVQSILEKETAFVSICLQVNDLCEKVISGLDAGKIVGTVDNPKLNAASCADLDAAVTFAATAYADVLEKGPCRWLVTFATEYLGMRSNATQGALKDAKHSLFHLVQMLEGDNEEEDKGSSKNIAAVSAKVHGVVKREMLLVYDLWTSMTILATIVGGMRSGRMKGAVGREVDLKDVAITDLNAARLKVQQIREETALARKRSFAFSSAQPRRLSKEVLKALHSADLLLSLRSQVLAGKWEAVAREAADVLGEGGIMEDAIEEITLMRDESENRIIIQGLRSALVENCIVISSQSGEMETNGVSSLASLEEALEFARERSCKSIEARSLLYSGEKVLAVRRCLIASDTEWKPLAKVVNQIQADRVREGVMDDGSLTLHQMCEKEMHAVKKGMLQHSLVERVHNALSSGKLSGLPGALNLAKLEKDRLASTLSVIHDECAELQLGWVYDPENTTRSLSQICARLCNAASMVLETRIHVLNNDHDALGELLDGAKDAITLWRTLAASLVLEKATEMQGASFASAVGEMQLARDHWENETIVQTLRRGLSTGAISGGE